MGENALLVYHEYPYLYEGTAEEYLPFIQQYADSEDGIASVIFDNEKLIGVAIGMPMNAMRENYQEPILTSSEKAKSTPFFI